MLDQIKTENVLFLDIETVPQSPDFTLIPENHQKLWDKKSSYFRKEDETAASVYQRAGIYAEFGKIICISAGIIIPYSYGDKYFRIKSFFGDDEKKIVTDFSLMLKNFSENHADKLLCAHNGKEFDFPFLARRMLINGQKLPKILDTAGKKPWEVNHLDTLELWKFGDYKHYTSLDLLSAIFNIPSPKDDIDGADVARVYWEEKNIQRIVSYCEKDVLTVAQVFLCYKGESLIKQDNVEKATS